MRAPIDNGWGFPSAPTQASLRAALHSLQLSGFLLGPPSEVHSPFLITCRFPSAAALLEVFRKVTSLLQRFKAILCGRVRSVKLFLRFFFTAVLLFWVILMNYHLEQQGDDNVEFSVKEMEFRSRRLTHCCVSGIRIIGSAGLSAARPCSARREDNYGIYFNRREAAGSLTGCDGVYAHRSNG